MKGKNTIGVFLMMLILCIAGLTIQGSAMSLSEFNQKKDAFLSDARWRDGTSWGGNQTPKSSSWSSTGCCAYAADFAKEVYGNNSPRGGAAFNNVSEVRTGDILHINNGETEHWFIVLARDGNQIYSAEGNYSGRVYVSTSHYWFNNGVLYTQLASGTRQVTLYEGYHFLDGISRFAYSIDSITNTKDGLKINGWVYDKQATSSQVYVHVYVGAPANRGEGHDLGVTDLTRGDVNNTFGISGKHGFSKTFTTVYSGTQTIYIYAITADGSYNELIATNTLLIGNDPIGNVESVTSPCAGVIRVVGWTIDKDGEGYPNSIHVYVGAPAGTSGAEVHPVDVNNQNLLAHEYREDVDTVHKFGKYHGFEVFIPTNKTGTQPVYVYGINLGNGSNAAIGNKQVTISTDDHKYDTGTTTRPATCTAGGTKNVTCTKCTLKTAISIPAFGHNYGEWSVTKAATYDAEGEEQRVCKNDKSHIETRKIAKLPKPAETEVTKPTETGVTKPTETEVTKPTETGVTKPTETEAETTNVTTSETEINETAVPTASAQQKTILAQKNDNDPKGSTFGSLQAKAVKVTKSSIRVQWKKVKGATKYVVYGNKCGKNNRYKKLKTVKTTSYTQKKLKKGTYYKYLVVAIKGSKAIATSKTIHAATTGGKVGNNKSVKVNKKSFSIGVGNKVKLEATAVAASNQLKVKNHRAIAFESSNKNIATVSKKGVIKGIRKGKCYVYAYAQNGVMAKVKVVVDG